MRKSIAAGALALLATGSSAYGQTTNCMSMGGGMTHCNTLHNGGATYTDCMSMGANTTCNSIGSPPVRSVAPISPTRPMSSVPDYDSTDSGAAQGMIAVVRSMQARSARSKVGKMIAAGQCREATQFALQKGYMELAEFANSQCRPATGAQATPRLDEILHKFASSAKVPTPMSDDTTLISVQARHSELRFIAQRNEGAGPPTDLERNLWRGEVCGNDDMRALNRAGVAMRALVFDKAGNGLGTVEAPPKSCD